MSASTVQPRPSGPQGSWLFGSLPQFGKNPLAFLEQCARDHGDFVPFRVFNKTIIVLAAPAHIEYVLTTNPRNFRKTIGYRTPFMRRLFGRGLLTSEGEHWLRQRRLAQPAFHRDRIATYAQIIVQFAGEMTAAWQPGETRNIHNDLMRLTTRVVSKTLFNSPPPPEINALNDSATVVMERFTTQWKWYRLLLHLLPTPSGRAFEKVAQRTDDFIYTLIRERRASGEDAGDLLSMLLQARDESGQGMTDLQVRDELVTLLLAGLDTTALALSWAFYLLSQNPTAVVALEAELEKVLHGRAPAFSDLPQLTYAESVIRETCVCIPPRGRLAAKPLRPAKSTAIP
jgi:cytochrome P450